MTNVERTRIIINPAAAAGRAAQRLTQVKPFLSNAWPQAEWCESESAQHLTDLCLDAADNQFRRVIVAGGDGTVHHAVRGLVNSKTALGVLPVGTGNDFAFAAGIPANMAAAARVLVAGHERVADLGSANDIPFCCIAGLGMDTPALQTINASTIRRGKLLYQITAIKTLLTFKPSVLMIEINGTIINEKIFFSSFCNTPTYAGGNPLAPAASIFDGALDYVLFADQPRLHRLITFAKMKRGRHIGAKSVRSGHANMFHISSDTPSPITLDGELTKLTTPAIIRLLPKSLRLICNANQERKNK